MPWIESHTGVERHPKILKAAAALGIKPVYMSGHIHALWHAALENQEDGNLAEWPDAVVAYQALYDGDSGEFVRVLVENGLLTENRRIYNWLHYVGKYLKTKYRRNPELLDQIMSLHGEGTGIVPDPAPDLYTYKDMAGDMTGDVSTLPNPTIPGDKTPPYSPPPPPEEGDAGAPRPSPRFQVNKRPEGLADSITDDDWRDFVAMRNRKRSPLTRRAVQLVVLKIEKLAGQSQDPRECLLQSIERGWTTVWPVRRESGRPQGMRALDELDRRMGRDKP